MLSPSQGQNLEYSPLKIINLSQRFIFSEMHLVLSRLLGIKSEKVRSQSCAKSTDVLPIRSVKICGLVTKKEWPRLFEHGCPNNTPAILWEPDFKESGWKGLFPNRTVSSFVASVFPAEIVRGDHVQILMDAGQKKLANSGALLRRGLAGRMILIILALIAKGQRKRSTLSFSTGLDVENCERAIQACIKWKFITVQRRITAKGLAELNAARKLKMEQSRILDKGSDYYYPKQLREATHD